MKTDSITWGETYDIEVIVNDENGAPITLDGTYQAACTNLWRSGLEFSVPAAAQTLNLATQ